MVKNESMWRPWICTLNRSKNCVKTHIQRSAISFSDDKLKTILKSYGLIHTQKLSKPNKQKPQPSWVSCNFDSSRECYIYLRLQMSHFYVISPWNSPPVLQDTKSGYYGNPFMRRCPVGLSSEQSFSRNSSAWPAVTHWGRQNRDH